MTNPEEQDSEMHDFWSKQPVVPSNAQQVLEGYIDQTIPVTLPPDSPSLLPASFTWATLDIKNDAQLDEVYNFLALNYVEDKEHKFRFLLSKDLLRWALTPPGYFPEWIFGVRTAQGALVGFISGVPYSIRLGTDIQPWCAVNFLCVHSHLRSKRMAQVLIFELARRVRVSKIYRAVFSGAEVPTKPFAKISYAHRPISIRKLSACDFYPVDEKKMGACQKRFAVPPLIHGDVRPMTEEDVPAVLSLLQSSTQAFKYAIQFTPELVKHMFLPVKDTIYSYVIPSSSGPQGFFSFYMMDWSILEENKMSITELKAAYVWYHASASIDKKFLIQDLLHVASRDAHADVVNGMMMMGSSEAMLANKFEKGNRELEFYSYNFAVAPVEDKDFCFFFI